MLHVCAQSGSKATGNVGGLCKIAGQLEIEAAQRDLGQAMRRVSGIEQIGIQHGIVPHALQLDAQRRERVNRSFVIVN